MIGIMYEISQNWWNFLLAFIGGIIALIGLIKIDTNKSVRRWIVIFACLCAIFFLFLITAKIYTHSYTKVPNIIGKSVLEAYKILEEKDLDFFNNFVAHPQDTIRYQIPEKNNYVPKNSYIEVITQQTLDDYVSMRGNCDTDDDFKALLKRQFKPSGAPLDGNSIIRYEDGSEYNGDYKYGFPDGKGVYITTTFRYEGSFSKGLPNGQGIFKNKDIYYSGDFYNSIFFGYGVAIFADGSTYAGSWGCNSRYGYGTHSWADVSRYTGDWVCDERNGYGTFIDIGYSYTGNWVGDNKHGKGRLTLSEGYVFVGADSEVNGHEREFDGYYKNDLRYGIGISYYKNGNYDIGRWSSNKKQGTFLCYTYDGELLREEKWIDGKLQR